MDSDEEISQPTFPHALSNRRAKKTLWLLVLMTESPAYRESPPFSRILVARAHPDDDYNNEKARTDLDRLDQAGYIRQKDERGMRGKVMYELVPDDMEHWKNLVDDLGLSAEDFEEFLSMDPLSFDIMHHFAVQYLGTSVLPATPKDVKRMKEDLQTDIDEIRDTSTQAYDLAQSLNSNQKAFFDELEKAAESIETIYETEDDVEELREEVTELRSTVERLQNEQQSHLSQEVTQLRSEVERLREEQESRFSTLEDSIDTTKKEAGRLWLMTVQVLIWILGHFSSKKSGKQKLTEILPSEMGILTRNDWYPEELSRFSYTDYNWDRTIPWTISPEWSESESETDLEYVDESDYAREYKDEERRQERR